MAALSSWLEIVISQTDSFRLTSCVEQGLRGEHRPSLGGSMSCGPGQCEKSGIWKVDHMV